MLSVGLSVLRRAPERRDDWILVIDHTVALGELKCFVVLGIPAARGPLKEIGRLVLLIAALLSQLTASAIRDAMTSVPSIDVEQWVENHLGPSMLARRRRALRADMKTA